MPVIASLSNAASGVTSDRGWAFIVATLAILLTVSGWLVFPLPVLLAVLT